MNSVKSISLDDMDELPNPIGVAKPDDTKHKAMHYTPAYQNAANSGMGLSSADADDLDEGTVRKGSLASGFGRFSQVLGQKKFSGGNRQLVLAGIFGMVLVGCGLYIYIGDEGLDSLMGDVGAGMQGDGEMAPPVEAAAPVPESGVINTTPEVAPPKTESKTVEEAPGNPYWKLPNPVVMTSETKSMISTQQTEGWRAALNHAFTYQRMKATQELRKAKVDGTVTILYEALAQPKFWTRMEAILGIADNGVAIDSESMKTAIGDARSDLVKNYFKRFRKDYTDSTAHVMRQALRVVDGRARFIIFSNLALHRNEINDQYLYAASLHETDVSTKAMVNEVLAQYPIPAAHKAAYEKSISEEAVIVTKKANVDIKVEKIPANMNVEEVYFINDEESAPAPAAEPVEVKKEDDGFNDLQHSEAETDSNTEDLAPSESSN